MPSQEVTQPADDYQSGHFRDFSRYLSIERVREAEGTPGDVLRGRIFDRTSFWHRTSPIIDFRDSFDGQSADIRPASMEFSVLFNPVSRSLFDLLSRQVCKSQSSADEGGRSQSLVIRYRDTLSVRMRNCGALGVKLLGPRKLYC